MRALREIFQEDRSIMLSDEHLADDGGSPDEVVEIVLASGDHLAITEDLRLGVVKLKLLIDSKGTTDISILFMENGSVEIRIDLIHFPR